MASDSAASEAPMLVRFTPLEKLDRALDPADVAVWPRIPRSKLAKPQLEAQFESRTELFADAFLAAEFSFFDTRFRFGKLQWAVSAKQLVEELGLHAGAVISAFDFFFSAKTLPLVDFRLEYAWGKTGVEAVHPLDYLPWAVAVSVGFVSAEELLEFDAYRLELESGLVWDGSAVLFLRLSRRSQPLSVLQGDALMVRHRYRPAGYLYLQGGLTQPDTPVSAGPVSYVPALRVLHSAAQLVVQPVEVPPGDYLLTFSLNDGLTWEGRNLSSNQWFYTVYSQSVSLLQTEPDALDRAEPSTISFFGQYYDDFSPLDRDRITAKWSLVVNGFSYNLYSRAFLKCRDCEDQATYLESSIPASLLDETKEPAFVSATLDISLNGQIYTRAFLPSSRKFTLHNHVVLNSVSPPNGTMMGGIRVQLTASNILFRTDRVLCSFKSQFANLSAFATEVRASFASTASPFCSSNCSFSCAPPAHPASTVQLSISTNGVHFYGGWPYPINYTFLPCAPGYKSPDYRSACSICPEGTVSSPDGKSCVRCQLHSFTQNPQANTVCTACPTNSLTKVQGSTSLDQCLCKGPTDLSRGFYKLTRDLSPCLPCVDHADCAGGWAVPAPHSGFTRSRSKADLMVECNPVEACQGGVTSACLPSYDANYSCSICSEAHYRYNGRCVSCPPSAPSPMFWAQIGCSFLLVTLLYLRMDVMIKVGSLGILLGFVESAGLIVGAFRLQWHQDYTLFFNVYARALPFFFFPDWLSSAALECNLGASELGGPPAELIYGATPMIPLVQLNWLAILFIFHTLCLAVSPSDRVRRPPKPTEAKKEWTGKDAPAKQIKEHSIGVGRRRRTVYQPAVDGPQVALESDGAVMEHHWTSLSPWECLTNTVLALATLQCTFFWRSLFQLWACTNEGNAYVRPYMPCFRAWSFSNLVPLLSIITAAVFLLTPLPLLLTRAPGSKHGHTSNRQYSYLFKRFRSGARRWDLILFIRKTVLIFGVSGLFSTNPVIQAFLSLLTVCISLFIHVQVEPYKSRSNNSMETYCLIVLLLLIFVSITFFIPELVRSDETFPIKAMLHYAGLFCFCFVVVPCLRVFKELKRRLQLLRDKRAALRALQMISRQAFLVDKESSEWELAAYRNTDFVFIQTLTRLIMKPTREFIPDSQINSLLVNHSLYRMRLNRAQKSLEAYWRTSQKTHWQNIRTRLIRLCEDQMADVDHYQGVQAELPDQPSQNSESSGIPAMEQEAGPHALLLSGAPELRLPDIALLDQDAPLRQPSIALDQGAHVAPLDQDAEVHPKSLPEIAPQPSAPPEQKQSFSRKQGDAGGASSLLRALLAKAADGKAIEDKGGKEDEDSLVRDDEESNEASSSLSSSLRGLLTKAAESKDNEKMPQEQPQQEMKANSDATPLPLRALLAKAAEGKSIQPEEEDPQQEAQAAAQEEKEAQSSRVPYVVEVEIVPSSVAPYAVDVFPSVVRASSPSVSVLPNLDRVSSRSSQHESELRSPSRSVSLAGTPTRSFTNSQVAGWDNKSKFVAGGKNSGLELAKVMSAQPSPNKLPEKGGKPGMVSMRFDNVENFVLAQQAAAVHVQEQTALRQLRTLWQKLLVAAQADIMAERKQEEEVARCCQAIIEWGKRYMPSRALLRKRPLYLRASDILELVVEVSEELRWLRTQQTSDQFLSHDAMPLIGPYPSQELHKVAKGLGVYDDRHAFLHKADTTILWRGAVQTSRTDWDNLGGGLKKLIHDFKLMVHVGNSSFREVQVLAPDGNERAVFPIRGFPAGGLGSQHKRRQGGFGKHWGIMCFPGDTLLYTVHLRDNFKQELKIASGSNQLVVRLEQLWAAQPRYFSKQLCRSRFQDMETVYALAHPCWVSFALPENLPLGAYRVWLLVNDTPLTTTDWPVKTVAVEGPFLQAGLSEPQRLEAQRTLLTTLMVRAPLDASAVRVSLKCGEVAVNADASELGRTELDLLDVAGGLEMTLTAPEPGGVYEILLTSTDEDRRVDMLLLNDKEGRQRKEDAQHMQGVDLAGRTYLHGGPVGNSLEEGVNYLVTVDVPSPGWYVLRVQAGEVTITSFSFAVLAGSPKADTFEFLSYNSGEAMPSSPQDAHCTFTVQDEQGQLVSRNHLSAVVVFSDPTAANGTRAMAVPVHPCNYINRKNKAQAVRAAYQVVFRPKQVGQHQVRITLHGQCPGEPSLLLQPLLEKVSNLWTPTDLELAIVSAFLDWEWDATDSLFRSKVTGETKSLEQAPLACITSRRAWIHVKVHRQLLHFVAADAGAERVGHVELNRLVQKQNGRPEVPGKPQQGARSRAVLTRKLRASHTSPITCMVSHTEYGRLFTGGENELCAWDLPSGKLLQKLEPGVTCLLKLSLVVPKTYKHKEDWRPSRADVLVAGRSNGEVSVFMLHVGRWQAGQLRQERRFLGHRQKETANLQVAERRKARVLGVLEDPLAGGQGYFWSFAQVQREIAGGNEKLNKDHTIKRWCVRLKVGRTPTGDVLFASLSNVSAATQLPLPTETVRALRFGGGDDLFFSTDGLRVKQLHLPARQNQASAAANTFSIKVRPARQLAVTVTLSGAKRLVPACVLACNGLELHRRLLRTKVGEAPATQADILPLKNPSSLVGQNSSIALISCICQDTDGAPLVVAGSRHGTLFLLDEWGDLLNARAEGPKAPVTSLHLHRPNTDDDDDHAGTSRVLLVGYASGMVFAYRFQLPVVQDSPSPSPVPLLPSNETQPMVMLSTCQVEPAGADAFQALLAVSQTGSLALWRATDCLLLAEFRAPRFRELAFPCLVWLVEYLQLIVYPFAVQGLFSPSVFRGIFLTFGFAWRLLQPQQVLAVGFCSFLGVLLFLSCYFLSEAPSGAVNRRIRLHAWAASTVKIISTLLVPPLSAGLAGLVRCFPAEQTGHSMSVVGHACMSGPHLALVMLPMCLLPAFWLFGLRVRLVEGDLSKLHRRLSLDWREDRAAATCFHDFLPRGSSRSDRAFTVVGWWTRVFAALWTVWLPGRPPLQVWLELLGVLTLSTAVYRHPPFVEKGTNAWNLALMGGALWTHIAVLIMLYDPKAWLFVLVVVGLLFFTSGWVLGSGLYQSYATQQYVKQFLRALREEDNEKEHEEHEEEPQQVEVEEKNMEEEEVVLDFV
eukprot:gb/GEZN01000031.1/.p1 GENE.gb/GEZN01000031.1/~~gb/GEZN01000031.1/.p1  ORF type:complete len:3643 (+),score=472.50 gb/GEZN01000031.1/:1561-10929(+)